MLQCVKLYLIYDAFVKLDWTKGCADVLNEGFVHSLCGKEGDSGSRMSRAFTDLSLHLMFIICIREGDFCARSLDFRPSTLPSLFTAPWSSFVLSAMSFTMSLLFTFSFKPLIMALTLAPGADICFLASVTSWMSLSRQSSVLLAHALCLFTTFSASLSAKSMFSIVLGTSDDSLRLHQGRLIGPLALPIVYTLQLKEHIVVTTQLREVRSDV